jgi:RNA polymerase sigma-70 factor, ECF subfamily
VADAAELARFEQAVLPHLGAAYNLARWLTGNDQDAQDIAQESCLRALRFFSGFRGGNSRPWLLTIVRNTYYTWRQHNRVNELGVELDEEIHAVENAGVEHGVSSPEAILLASAQGELVRRAVAQLPAEFREVVVLREMEEMSYKEIAEVAGIPVGTVMSRLARARGRLQQLLASQKPSEAST